MKKILLLLFVISFSAQAQVDTYDYLYFCDKMMANTNNSIDCLQGLYADLQKFKKSPDTRFRYFESYICIQQPDQKLYDKIKAGPNTFFKTVANDLWKLYNDCYTKNGEIIAYLRLEDYKTNLEKGFSLLSELQQLQISMGKARDRLADKVVAEAKSPASTNSYTKPCQSLMAAIVHEDDLIRKLSQNFKEETFIGFQQDEILKSFLETDDILQNLTTSRFAVPEPAYLKSCIEGLQLIQQTKQHALDNFNNTSTLDGSYANTLYDNLQNYFNNDILHFYSNLCGQARVNYYPVALREFDLDSPSVAWPLAHIDYSLPSLDSLKIITQPAPLPKAGFKQLNDLVYYIDVCVLSMEHIFKSLRSEGSTWNDIREGDMPYRNPLIKFDKVTVPVSLHALLVKDSKHIPTAYRKGIVDQLNDLQQIMLAMQEHLMGLSQYMNRGDFRKGDMAYIDTTLKTVEMLYTEFDIRKERLFMQTRKAYVSYPPQKKNSWNTAASALLKAADDSREILRKMDRRVYKQDESPISTSAIHDDQRNLIVNQLAYMKGIVRLDNSGLSPYIPYEYIPGYLKTLEEKIVELPVEFEDKNKAYGDILYMHNIVVYQFNKFADLGLGDNEYGVNDPMRPVYILSYIRQPPKYHYEIRKPKEPEPAKEPEVAQENELVPEVPVEPISFEGYAFNNLVLLLDVSASMNKPERLPLLKESFQQLVRLMRKEDEVSIVIYSGKATLHLPPHSASDTTTIIRAIQSLRSDGVTNIADGMALAYKTAKKNFIEDGNNKIIIATDGEFKVTETLLKLVEKNSPKMILSVFDFSQVEDPLKAMQLLAEKGNGNYVKVTTENSLQVLADEARKEKRQ